MKRDHPLTRRRPGHAATELVPVQEPSWDGHLTEQFGAGTVCAWTRTLL
jgi:hypothetical protein